MSGWGSTATDMLAFLEAHLVPAPSSLAWAIELCVAPRRQIRGALRIGLGWHVFDRRPGAPFWWHNGGTGGFFSFVGFVPDSQVAVVVLTNTARSVDQLGMQLLTEDAPEPLCCASGSKAAAQNERLRFSHGAVQMDTDRVHRRVRRPSCLTDAAGYERLLVERYRL